MFYTLAFTESAFTYRWAVGFLVKRLQYTPMCFIIDGQKHTLPTAVTSVYCTLVFVFIDALYHQAIFLVNE